MLAKSDCLREPEKKKQRQHDYKPRPSLFWTEERPDKTYVRAVYILIQPDFVRLKERTEHLGYHSNSEKSRREEVKNIIASFLVLSRETLRVWIFILIEPESKKQRRKKRPCIQFHAFLIELKRRDRETEDLRRHI
jgi:hypothetical protein